MPVESIKLAVGLRENHQIALLKSITDPIAASPQERQDLLEAIDLLRSSRVRIDGQDLSFAGFFEKFIDRAYTDKFVAALLKSKQISAHGQREKKKIIEEIRALFIQEQWFRHDLPETRFLIAFCLYWWNAFATGYMFEIQIFRDLRKSGLRFEAHDLRQRSERYSFADLTISQMTGDIKSSTYFFSIARTSDLSHDFYITRYYDQSKRQYHWFVIMRSESWNEIDGTTLPMIFPNWPVDFSTPVTFDFGGTDWVAVSYHIWKTKILEYQHQGEQ
ncbi:MAG: hypothetical protein ONB44_19395 [candidate division KSB1 bacterium]|nr:hypothetical protein [candidate division KSB1 bacterium]MDZ7304295.1 hypothetical protein [candidate division KSB1 bacterium]MDZ7312907.1 hypothetical protein [candidate division KSB1 bacterium]